MTSKCVKYSVLFVILFLYPYNSRGQETYINTNNALHFISDQNKSSATLPLSIGVVSVLYLINPVLIYENKKVYAGITKEVSLGWGKMGEHRTAFEYSLILGGQLRHFIRFSYKYDILLDKKIEPSHMLQSVPVISAGAGYFNDFRGGGVFPELTYGYSIRNHKLLIYPHIKLRHTFMLNQDKPDITDISAGIMIGFANPFIDVNIRRKY